MALDLTKLEELPGAPDENFEVLTRAIVSRRFGALGNLRERRQQPGVEFYLPVEHEGELGEPGRVWGWSCKWFILGTRNELTASQRKQIEESLDKAIGHVAGLTDLVFCLPERPAKKDEEWIDGLGSSEGILTRLWAAENFDAELSGLDGVRSTFFGELALTPEMLAAGHERAVAPVKGRWVPTLHVSNNAERQLERALLRPPTFDRLEQHLDAIAARTLSLRGALGDVREDGLRTTLEQIADDFDGFNADLQAILDAGRNGRPTEAFERISHQQPPDTSPRQLHALVVHLRRTRSPVALNASGMAIEIRGAVSWLQDALADLDAPLVAVVGAAGLGKTHLAAQLTAPAGNAIAGVFIQGAKLRAGASLDDLATRVPGIDVDRFDNLLEALEAAGARAGARLPVIIDGLNEAERPSEWRPLLEELTPVLCNYPHVVVVVTLREVLAETALPDGAAVIDAQWDQPDTDAIVDAYFDHYLINAADAWIPVGMFHNPLFVRLYCEAANPLRQQAVGIEALPTSLMGVFELYRESFTKRLAEDPVRTHVPASQISRRLGTLAMEMWERGLPRLPSEEARDILDAGETDWDESLFRRLEEEGVLFRDGVDGGDDTETGVLFDRFAGYLIGDALLASVRLEEIEERLADPDLWADLVGQNSRSLGEDVAVSLVGLVPRRFRGHHLWRFAPQDHQAWTLVHELDSESTFLDDETITALVELIVDWPIPENPQYLRRRHPFDRLWEIRRSPAHQLNARFLDRVLRTLSLAERDRRWTEWVRHRAGDLLADVKAAITSWSENPARCETDDIEAAAIAWLMTSTREDVRDAAMQALQRFGRPDPSHLFDLAVRMLDADDPYVVERVIGAAFGAATAHQMPSPGGPFEYALSGWLVTLKDRFLVGGSSPTDHELLRSYVRATFEFAGILHPGALPDGVDSFSLTFAPGPSAPTMLDDHPDADECARTFGMDFENYVIGSAIDGRSNYDFDHEAFRKARGEVMARIWSVGWRAALFDDIDEAIGSVDNQPFHDRAKVERYGKKYGWIAFYELVGRLTDEGQPPRRWVGGARNVTPDIDPTFPEEPPRAVVPLPAWAPTGSVDDEQWLRNGSVEVPEDLWAPGELEGIADGWLLADGFLEHRRDGRVVWGFFHALLLDPADMDAALDLIRETEYLGNDFIPRIPTVRDVFAGEAPWNPRFQVRPEPGDSESHPAIGSGWSNEGIAVDQVAVEFDPGEGDPSVRLARSYSVPSYELAARFGLRQLPNKLDLVDLNGKRASATYSVEEPWKGHLLFVRRDLMLEFAEGCEILQIGWGERQLPVDWSAVPAWVREAQQDYEVVWRSTQTVPDC